MPFLFVDYDQGAGGERFCAGLSQSPECETLEFARYPNGRTKVLDVFRQEFIKPNPKIQIVKPHNQLYTLVPTHRKTKIAKELLENVYSIRIQTPSDPILWQKIKEHQIKKVLLTKEPTPEYFFGLLKILQESAIDKNFVRRVKHDMLNVELILLAKGIDPTEKNIEEYLETVKNTHVPEPQFDYDLVIPYEELVTNPNSVKNKIKNRFQITVVGDWLNSYA